MSKPEKDLFGQGGTWKTNAYPAPPGSGPRGKTCRDCQHIVVREFNNRRYYKCGFLTCSRCISSDIRLKTRACLKFEHHIRRIR